MAHQGHAAMYEEVPRLDPRSYTPPPISPVSPEEPTIKKRRKRADAAQLKVLNKLIIEPLSHLPRNTLPWQKC